MASTYDNSPKDQPKNGRTTSIDSSCIKSINPQGSSTTTSSLTINQNLHRNNNHNHNNLNEKQLVNPVGSNVKMKSEDIALKMEERGKLLVINDV